MIKAGIYIHIPFCTVKCLYCDFYSITERENSIDRFISAITKEIDVCNTDVSKWAIDTIFIGGGTPSLLNGKQIEYNQMKTLITPGLIAGDKTAVDKTLEVLKEK